MDSILRTPPRRLFGRPMRSLGVAGRAGAVMAVAIFCAAELGTLHVLANAQAAASRRNTVEERAQSVSILSLTRPRRGAAPRLVSDETGVFMSNDPGRADTWLVESSDDGTMTIMARDGVNKGKYLSIDKDNAVVLADKPTENSRWVRVVNTTGGMFIKAVKDSGRSGGLSLGMENPEKLRASRVFTDRVKIGQGIRFSDF